jgi:hypothetical protein
MTDVRDAPASNAEDAVRDALPAAEPPQPEPAKDDPFAAPPGPRLSESKPEPADTMRVWTDVTGKHEVRGQMKQILIAQGKVRILKETGKFTTVPLAKLSEGDRLFVAQYSNEPSLLLAESR